MMDPQSQSCEPMLRESIKHFLAAYRSGSSDFSAFQSIFFRLIQTMPDPPLEIIWFYSAVTFHAAKATPDRPLNKMLVIAKDLFQQLISCNDSRNGLRRTALLAPVVFVLYEIVRDSSSSGPCLRWEAEDLLDKMVSYIQMSCGDDFQSGKETDLLVVCFEDLVRVWTIDRVEEGSVVEENLKVLFPVWSDEVWIGIDGRYGIDRLAGIVLCELFWLRLCLKIRLGVMQEELQKDLQNCAVQTIKSFQNSYIFLDMLLRMLLEATLPITNLLSSEDAVSLMKVLYDTVLLGECSFLNSGTWMQLLDDQSRNLALVWSLVADNAVQCARDSSDHSRALSYANSFCKSQLSSLLIKWFSREAGIEEKCGPYIGNPKDLIRWISVLEDKGLVVIDKSISKLLTKAAAPKLGQDSTIPSSIISYSDDSKKGECKTILDEEMIDPPQDTDQPAVISTERPSEGRRKRKEGLKEEDEPRIKLVKSNFHDSTMYTTRYSSGV